jgi:hypothetical protein
MQFKLIFQSSVLLVVGALSAVASAQVVLQNASATFSQAFTGPWTASQMIDGNLSDLNGWAVFRTGGGDPTLAETAVFETATDLSASALSLNMVHNYSPNFPGHLVGRFRWSYTTDNRNDFADGLQNGGDVTANWTVLTPSSVIAPSGMTSSVLGDGSVLMAFTGGPLATGTYTVNFATLMTDATGLRLEVMPDPSLPVDGPGLYAPNGNFVITEIQATAQAVPEPATMTVLAAATLGLIRRKRKASL